MISTNERSIAMKLKPLVVAMALVTTGASAEVRYSNEVQNAPPVVVASYHDRLAPVVNVEPVTTAQSFPQTSHVCRQEAVPMYRDVPVTSTSYQKNSGVETLGMLVGAAIGGSVVAKSDRLAGVIIGGAIGHAATSQPTVTTTVHGYTTEFVGYRDIQKCEVVHGSYEKRVVIGYNVTYNDNGTFKTVTMTRHPGAYVRIQ
jgi:uncharacterized protein YcfJ